MFVLDLNRLTIVEEMQILGHKPRPVKELFPNLQLDLQASLRVVLNAP